MSTDTGQKYRDAFGALFAPDGDSTSEALIDNMLQIKYNATRGTVMAENADSTVNSVWSSTLDRRTTVRMLVQEAYLISDNSWSTTSNVNTNVAILSLVYNNGNGGSDTTIATINTATVAGGGGGLVTASVPYALTINTTNQVVPAGSLLAFKLTKSGAGGCSTGTFSISVKAKPV